MQNKDKGDGIEDSPLDMLLVILLEGASKEVVTPSSEAHVGLGHLEWSPIGSFWACSLLLGLLMGLGLKVHVGHVLGLKHDLGLGVDPNYKPCWDHIRFHLLITCFSTFTPTGVAALTMPQPPQLKFDVTTTTIIISVWFFHVLVFATLS